MVSLRVNQCGRDVPPLHTSPTSSCWRCPQQRRHSHKQRREEQHSDSCRNSD